MPYAGHGTGDGVVGPNKTGESLVPLELTVRWRRQIGNKEISE